MSQFFEDLWESIFTPGPTPTLLVATNATFAVLQVVLSVLLFATFSIHFVILSFLSAGLWWAINWFARELKAAQLREEAAQRLKPARPAVGVGAGADEDEDADEENEQSKESRKRHRSTRRIATPQTSDSDTEVEAEPAPVSASVSAPVSAPVGSTAGAAEPVEKKGELKQRKPAATAAEGPVTTPATAPEVPASPPLVSASHMADSPPKGHHPSGSRSGVSTEDEWEKVSENEKDK